MKKKNVLIWLVVAIVMFFLGGILITVGIGLGADVSKSGKYFNINMSGEIEMVTGQSESYDGVKKIDVDADNLRVEFLQSDDDVYYIDYSVSDEYAVPKITYNDGTLKVKQEERGFFINIDFFGWVAGQEEYIKVYVPKDAKLDDVDISTSNGRIEIKQQIEIGTLKVDTSNGSVSLSEVTCTDKTDVKTSNGSVKCDGTFKDEVVIKTSNGSVTLGGTYDEGVDVKTSNGRIKAEIDGDKDDYDINIDTSNGSVTVNGDKVGDDYEHDVDADKEIKLKSSNGSIELDME